jgi:NhaA family Na+:H+ antiporter
VESLQEEIERPLGVQVRNLFQRFTRLQASGGLLLLASIVFFAALAIAERLQTPAQRLEHALTPWATFVVLPLFALANAGVALQGDAGQLLQGPVALGTLAGLVVGKPLGVSLFAWLAVRLKLAEMPESVSPRQLFSASWLAGIGFTMSLFLANAAFEGDVALQAVKLSVLLASSLAGVVGATFLWLTSAELRAATPLAGTPSAS